MNKQIKIGSYNTLLIARNTKQGLYLQAEDESEVLLPKSFVQEDMKLGQLLKVFVYTDSEDRVVATTIKPKLTVGEFGFLEVVDRTDFGVFVDIGLQKDIFVPKKMQKGNLKVGQNYLFALTLDIQTQRLIADMRIHRYLDKEPSHARSQKEVELLVIAKTPLGYKVIANNKFEGMLYHDEIYTSIMIGQKLTGWLKKVRKDGKLDYTINPIGKNKSQTNSQKVVDILKQHQGKLPFTYKSDSQEITKTFGMSKKAFKASLTELLKTNQIILNEKFVMLK